MNSSANEELERAIQELRRSGIDAALLSSVANVTYVSGFEVPFPIGAGAEIAYGVSLALFDCRGGGSALIVSASNVAAAKAHSRLEEIYTFDTFDTFNALDSRQSFLQRIREALHAAGLQNGAATLGIEARTLPYAVVELLTITFPNLTLRDVDIPLQQARLIKTEREISLLRRAAQVADIGHQTLADLCRTAGKNEFEMWSEITSRMFRAVGHEIPVVGELVTGPRTCVVNYPGGPRDRVTQAGDGALMDISQRIDGYWSDCTNTHVIGAEQPPISGGLPSSQDACEAAMDTLRIGKRASDVAKAAEAAFQKHGMPMAHYTGHQIGVTVNELPRLVHYDDTPIEAGMVFSVEPGAYEGPEGTFGARSEKIVLVTPSGPEILSTFAWGI